MGPKTWAQQPNILLTVWRKRLPRDSWIKIHVFAEFVELMVILPHNGILYHLNFFMEKLPSINYNSVVGDSICCMTFVI